MKRAFLLFALLLSAPAMPGAADAPPSFALRAGAAVADITPREFPVNMPGNFSANRAQGAHDPLRSSALVLDDGATQLAMVVIDHLGASPEILDEAKRIASQKTGLAVERMLISSTHSHSGGPLFTMEDAPPQAVAYRRVLVEGNVESIVKAREALRPAAMRTSAHPLPEEVFNRRWYPKPGKMPPNPFGAVRPPREPFEQARIVAQKAADTAWLAHQKIGEHRVDAPLGMIQREVALKYRRPTAAQVEEATAILAATDKEVLAKQPSLAQHYARNTLTAAHRPEETLTVIVQALRIGDLAVCGLSFETFVETGLANGRHGYLPTPEQHKLGGYETWLGTSLVEEDASVILTTHLLEMLAELKKAG